MFHYICEEHNWNYNLQQVYVQNCYITSSSNLAVLHQYLFHPLAMQNHRNRACTKIIHIDLPVFEIAYVVKLRQSIGFGTHIVLVPPIWIYIKTKTSLTCTRSPFVTHVVELDRNASIGIGSDRCCYSSQHTIGTCREGKCSVTLLGYGSIDIAVVACICIEDCT